MKGTLEYQAPEIILRGSDDGVWQPMPTDIWSYSCVVAEVVTGSILFVPLGSTVRACEVAILFRIF